MGAESIMNTLWKHVLLCVYVCELIDTYIFPLDIFAFFSVSLGVKQLGKKIACYAHH